MHGTQIRPCFTLELGQAAASSSAYDLTNLVLRTGAPELFNTAILITHIALASLVTGHALLNKRNVRSAIGWIGLAWLSPGLGAGLYYAFGVNRIARRAVKTVVQRTSEPKPADPVDACPLPALLNEQMTTLSEVAKRLTGEELVFGNLIDILNNGDDAYPAMIAEIEAAKTSICLATYIFRSDEVGDRFVDALIAAHLRGVEVRVLVDAVGTGFILSKIVRRLKANGVRVARFMFDWKPWSPALINLRNP